MPMAADLFYLTKTAECVRSYPDKFHDYYRGSLNDRNCDLSFHNESYISFENYMYRKKKQVSVGADDMFFVVH